MIQLLWGLLNLALFIYFLYLCVQALKLVGSNLGKAAAFVFGLGLFSFVCVSKQTDIAENKTFTFNSKDSIRSSPVKSVRVDLDRNLVNKYRLRVHYGYHIRTGRPVPLEAYSTTEGTTLSVRWQPEAAWLGLHNDSSDTYEFNVNGTVSWELFGMGIINQGKSYTQSIKLE